LPPRRAGGPKGGCRAHLQRRLAGERNDEAAPLRARKGEAGARCSSSSSSPLQAFLHSITALTSDSPEPQCCLLRSGSEADRGANHDSVLKLLRRRGCGKRHWDGAARRHRMALGRGHNSSRRDTNVWVVNNTTACGRARHRICWIGVSRAVTIAAATLAETHDAIEQYREDADTKDPMPKVMATVAMVPPTFESLKRLVRRRWVLSAKPAVPIEFVKETSKRRRRRPRTRHKQLVLKLLDFRAHLLDCRA